MTKPSWSTYRRVGHHAVRGFLQSEVLEVVETLDDQQRRHGVSGAVAEIGVHHGKFFVGLSLLQPPGATSVAIDVFDDQDLNVDQSGAGNLAVFRRQMNRWGNPDGLVVHAGDSTALTPAALLALAGAPVRLFSVDGGHTEEIVLSDMALAESTLVPGGVVIADDVFNQMWPGVAVGTVKYFAQGGTLVPFFIGFNKVFLTTPEHAADYRQAVAARFAGRWLTAVLTSEFVGHEVGLLHRVPRTPVELLRQSQPVRTAYRHLRGRPA